MDGCVPIAYLVWAQGDTNSHSGFHHTAYMMWAQEATCMNAVCMNIMKTNICTISASVFVSSATKVSRRTNQAQTVSKWNGRRCFFHVYATAANAFRYCLIGFLHFCTNAIRNKWRSVSPRPTIAQKRTAIASIDGSETSTPAQRTQRRATRRARPLPRHAALSVAC